MQSTSTVPSSRGWRILRRLLIGIAILATAIALLYAVEDLHGHFAWAACQRECAAQGLELNPHALEPAPVPDDENFAMTPFLAALLDFNPTPIKRGQSAWRDASAHQKAMDFAQDFWKAYDSSKSHLDDPGHPMLDLIALANALHKQAKTALPNFTTRAEAAADILRALDPYAPVLNELRAASARPYSRFNVQYNDPNPAEILLPHLSVLKKAAWVSAYRASAELALGKTDAAFDDLQLSLYMADALHGEPFMISHLVRLAILGISQRVLWEGLAAHSWSDQQLLALQTRLSKMTLLDDSLLSLRWELAAHGTTLFEYLQHGPTKEVVNELGANGAALPLQLVPSGWFQLERASYVRIYSGLIFAGYDSKLESSTPRISPQLKPASPGCWPA